MEKIHEDIENCDGCPNQLPNAGCVSFCPPDRKSDSIDYFKGEYAFLSNFFAFPMRYNGMTWRTSEHSYQAAKTDDPIEKMAIKMASSPGKAKKMGKTCKLVAGWDDIRDSVMEDILRAKFAIPELQAMLLSTGDAYLREGNFWGDYHFGQVMKDGKWVGDNVLGKLLMKIREELTNGSRPTKISQ